MDALPLAPRRLALRKLRSALRLPAQEKLWFLFLYPLSGLARAALLSLPFRLIARTLGTHRGNIQVTSPATAEHMRLAARIGRIVELAARYTPWQSKCLVQAILAKTLLAHYRVPYVLYLGVTKSKQVGVEGGGNAEIKSGGLKAHAWVAVGPRVITGREGHRAFAVVSTYVGPSQKAEGLTRPERKEP